MMNDCTLHHAYYINHHYLSPRCGLVTMITTLGWIHRVQSHMCMYILCPSDANIPRWPRQLLCLVHATRNSDYLRKLNLWLDAALQLMTSDRVHHRRAKLSAILSLRSNRIYRFGRHTCHLMAVYVTLWRSDTSLWVICTNILQHQGHFRIPISRCKRDACNWLGHRSLIEGGRCDYTAHTMHQERLWASY